MDWLFAHVLDLITNENDRVALAERYVQHPSERNPVIASEDTTFLGGFFFGLAINFIDRPFQLLIGMTAILYLAAKLLAYLIGFFL